MSTSFISPQLFRPTNHLPFPTPSLYASFSCSTPSWSSSSCPPPLAHVNLNSTQPSSIQVTSPLPQWGRLPFVRYSYATSLHASEAEPAELIAFFRGLGLREKQTELILCKNPGLRYIPLGLYRVRVGSLQSVGVDGLVLSQLIVKCPSVLTALEIDPFVCFLREDLEGRVDPKQVKRLLSADEPGLLVGFDKKVNLLIEHGVPKDKVVHILNNVNLIKAFCVKSVDEIERLLNFLTNHGGIDLVVRRPLILHYDLDGQVVPRVEFLVQLSGGNKEAVGTILRRLPAILSYSVEHLESHVELLRSFAGLDEQEIFKIFLVFPNVISASKDRKLHPRIDFLKQCSLTPNEIFKFLTKAPLFLGLSYEENLTLKLGFLIKIGYRYRTKELASAVGAVTRTSCENLQKVIELFLGYGFSFEDILEMSKKHPQILQYNPNSLEEKVEYLIGEMGREVEELLAFPAFLGYSLDRRIKRRYEEKKETRGEGMSLNKLLSVSTERFTRKEEAKLSQKA